MNSTLARTRTALVPGLTRESISWSTTAPGLVEIRIDLHNDADRPTEPADLVIETAGLGAFVPFRPMTRIAVGALEPGGRRQVRTTVARRDLPAQPNVMSTLVDALRTLPDMPAGFLDLLREAEWAGNLNVYFDRRPDRAVEVHRALDLRVAAGKPIALMIDLPWGRTDYQVQVRTTHPSWTAQVAALNGSFHFLVVRPPAVPGMRTGVTVEAKRLRDNRIVPVDFTFETVDGAGGSLGCIQV